MQLYPCHENYVNYYLFLSPSRNKFPKKVLMKVVLPHLPQLIPSSYWTSICDTSTSPQLKLYFAQWLFPTLLSSLSCLRQLSHLKPHNTYTSIPPVLNSVNRMLCNCAYCAL